MVSFQRGHSQLFQLSENWQEVEVRGLLSVASGLLSPLTLGVQGLSPAWLRKGAEAIALLCRGALPSRVTRVAAGPGVTCPMRSRAPVPVGPFCLSKDESEQLGSEAAKPGPAAPVTKPLWRLPPGAFVPVLCLCPLQAPASLPSEPTVHLCLGTQVPSSVGLLKQPCELSDLLPPSPAPSILPRKSLSISLAGTEYYRLGDL